MFTLLHFPVEPHGPAARHVRGCAFAPRSLHIYRRALLRRIGVPAGDRPAAPLNALAMALIAARV